MIKLLVARGILSDNTLLECEEATVCNLCHVPPMTRVIPCTATDSTVLPSPLASCGVMVSLMCCVGVQCGVMWCAVVWCCMCVYNNMNGVLYVCCGWVSMTCACG